MTSEPNQPVDPSVSYVVTDAHRRAAAQCITPSAGSRRSPIRDVIAWAVFIVLGIALFAFLQTRRSPSGQRASRVVHETPTMERDAWMGGLSIVVGFAVAYVPLRFAGRLTATPKTIGERFAITDRGVEWSCPHQRRLEPWSRFAGRYEGDRVAVLKRVSGPNVVLPDDSMPDAMQQALRDHLVCLGRSVA